MRISLYGYTIGTKASGAKQYAADLGGWLTRNGHKVTLVTGGRGERSAFFDGLTCDFIASHPSPEKKLAQAQFAFRSLVYFSRHRKDFDLIHSVSSFPQFIPLVLWVKKVTGLPVVHTLLAPCAPRPFFNALDGLICVSRGIQDKVRTPRATLIPPVIDLERFRTSSPLDLGHPGDLRIGTMGAPFVRKGVRHVVEAIPMVLSGYPRVHFFLAIRLPGLEFIEETKNEMEYVTRFVSEHHLQNNVTVLGDVEVPGFLKSLDLFVYAVQTTLGMIDIPPTLLESLAAGCGTVSSRAGAIEELIEDGANGLLVAAGHHGRPEAYAEKLLQLIRDRTLLEKIRRNGPPSVERFDLNQGARQVADLYQRVVLSRKGRKA